LQRDEVDPGTYRTRRVQRKTGSPQSAGRLDPTVDELVRAPGQQREAGRLSNCSATEYTPLGSSKVTAIAHDEAAGRPGGVPLSPVRQTAIRQRPDWLGFRRGQENGDPAHEKAAKTRGKAPKRAKLTRKPQNDCHPICSAQVS